MIRPPRSLQARLLVPALATVSGVWLIIALLTWFDVRHEVGELLDAHLAQAAALLVAQHGGAAAEDEAAAPAPALHRYARKVAFQVLHEGRMTQRSANAPAAPWIAPGEPFRGGYRTIQVGDAAWRVFATQGPEPDIRLYVAEELSSRSDILRAVFRSTLQPLALALPLLALALWWSVRRGVAPLRRLGLTLAAREPLALQPVAVDDAPTEMLPMLAALNGLLGRIAGLIESERRFTADAAHELRTPIAAIRAQAQVALGATDDLQRMQALRSTLQGCDRATRVVEQLLTLARLDAGAAPGRDRVDLCALVRSEVGEVAPRAIAKQQELSLEADSPCVVTGDATLLAVLVRNLVDNAVRYGPSSASIAVQLRHAPGRIVLTVDNGGAPVPAADVARLGERFFRVSGSGESGSGLGWSIVRRVAQVHGAAVEVAPAGPLGGLSVRVEFAAAGGPNEPAPGAA